MDKLLSKEIVNLNLNIGVGVVTVVIETTTHAVTLTTITHTPPADLQTVIDFIYDITPLIIAGELLDIDTVVETLKSVTEMRPHLEVFI